MISLNNISYKTLPLNNFGGLKDKKLTDEEKMQNYVQYVIGKLQERSEREVPDYGHFSPLVYAFPIPNSQNDAVFTIKHNLTADNKERVFETGVKRQGSDRIISNIEAVGEKKEIMKHLSSLDKEDVIQNISRLSKKVDDYYSGKK